MYYDDDDDDDDRDSDSVRDRVKVRVTSAVLVGLTKTSRDAGTTPGHLDRLIDRCTIPWDNGTVV